MLQPVQHALPCLGEELGEGEVLELGLEPLHADPLRQRGIDLHGLDRDPPALLRALDEAQRAHVVQAVGELHQQHADVVRHREQELPEVLGLGALCGLQLDLVELRYPVDQPADGGAEQAIDVVERGAGVLDRVVQECRRDRGGIEPVVGEDARDLDRMVEIGVARGAELDPVRLHREHVGPVEQVLVDVGVVGPDPLDQLVLPHHPAARLARGCRLRRLGGRRLPGDHDLERFTHGAAACR